jgi:hypothetical protein
MNTLLAHYRVDVQHPEVSGAEHLEMLQLRDRLAAIEPRLTTEEQNVLAEADRALVTHAVAFAQEIQRFLNLQAYRHEHGIPPTHWWWYLDVVCHVPRFVSMTAAHA